MLNLDIHHTLRVLHIFASIFLYQLLSPILFIQEKLVFCNLPASSSLRIPNLNSIEVTPEDNLSCPIVTFDFKSELGFPYMRGFPSKFLNLILFIEAILKYDIFYIFRGGVEGILYDC